MLGKIVLWITAVMFVVYGVACFISPALPAGYAGLAMTNGDAFAEVGAMYGGLQTGIGLFCALGATRAAFYRPALTLLLLGVGLLAVGRLYSALLAEATVGGYTWSAMAYEFGTAILAGIALKKG
jgi:hypothetical protein